MEMTALWGKRRTDVLRLVATVAMGALAAACASGGDSYQAEAMQASDKGDLKTATSLAQKEVDKYSASDQCSSTTNYNCGTLALAYSSLAEYQIRSGDLAAGERSFDRAKGALQRVPKDNKPSATGMVYRDVSEAFWKAGDKQRAIAVFREGTTRGADEWLYTSSAAKAVAQQEGRPATPPPGTAPAGNAPAGSPPASAAPGGKPGVTPAVGGDEKINPTMVNDPAVNPYRVNEPSVGPTTGPFTPSPLAPLAPSPLTTR
jgi:hypothetical protein